MQSSLNNGGEIERIESLKALDDLNAAINEHAIVAITDPQGRITYVNDKFCLISQYSRQELIGQDHRIINSGFHTKEFIRNLWATISQGIVWKGEIKNKAKDGTLYWMATTIVPFLNADGSPRQYVSIRTDITERKKAENALAIRLEEIVEASDDAVIGKDLNGIITSWNKGAEKIFGYSAGEIVGCSILKLIPDDQSDEEAQILGKVRQGRSAGNFETVRKTKNGKLIHVSVTACPIKDANNGVIGALKIARDITLQKTHERENSRLSQLYAALSQVNQAIVTQHSRDELFRKICQCLVKLGGFRMAWIGWLDNPTSRIIPIAQWGDSTSYVDDLKVFADERPEGQGPTGTAIREGWKYICNDFLNDPRTLPWRVAAGKAGFRASAVFPIKQGGVVCGAISVYSDEAGFFQDKEIALLEEAASDVSFALDNLAREEARQRVEDELRWKTAFLEAQVDSSLDGILVVDDKGRKILQNQRMNELWKIPPHISEDKNDAVQVAFVASRAKNPQQFAEKVAYLYSHPDEVSRDEIELVDRTILDRYSSPVRDKTGQYYGRIWAFRDITERRKLEAQLRQSQKMESIGHLAGGVAHDFNNILSAIMMQAELARLVDNTPEEVREGLAGIRSSAERAADLTRQLLLFSRKQVMQPRLLNLNDAVASLTRMLQRIVPENVSLQLQLHAVPLMTYADAGMVDQLLMNLVVNARDAMPKGGRLIIETAEKVVDPTQTEMYPEAYPGRYVWLSVSDTGDGISPEVLPHIFEPFFTTKEPGKGTGLGLATVFGIVKQHKGWVNVYSEQAKGRIFRFFYRLVSFPPRGGPQVARPKVNHWWGRRLFLSPKTMLRYAF